MANAAISYVNLADLGTITVSSEEPQMPGVRLQDEHVHRRWRSQTEPAYLIVDLGSAKTIDTIGLFGGTWTSAATMQVRGSLSDPTVTGSLAFDSGVLSQGQYLDSDYHSLVYIRASASVRYLRIDVVDATMNYVEAGRLFVGLREEFTYNFAPGASMTWDDLSRKTKTPGGQTLIFPDSRFRSIELSFEWVTKVQREGLVESIDRINGQSVDVIMILDTASVKLPRDSVFGLITQPTPILYSSLTDIFAKPYRIEERL
jgi:hypothetical protein